MNIEVLFTTIYDDTISSTTKYVISKCDNLSNTQDIIQNIYFKLYNTLCKKGIDYIKNYPDFVFKLTRNELFQYYFLKKKDNSVLYDDGVSYEEIGNNDEIISVFSKLTHDEIWEFVKEEKIEIQKILTLYFLNDCSFKEIASLLNSNENTVKSNFYRTIKKIKTHFTINEEVCYE